MLPTSLRRRPVSSDYESPVDAFFKDILGRWWTDTMAESAVGAYPVDIREDDEHIYVDAELPGFTKDQIEVTLEKGMLHITAERKEDEAAKKGQPHLTERRFTRVARSFTLPIAVDESNVDAKLSDGVLRLVLNKREEVKPRRITVK